MVRCGDLTENIENPLEACVYAETVVGPFWQVRLPQPGEEDEILKIEAVCAALGKVALELKHLLPVLFGDRFPDRMAGAAIPDGSDLVVESHAGGVM